MRSSRHPRSLNVALPAAMALLIAVALFSSWSIFQLREAIRYERQSNVVEANVHNVFELVQGAESSQRGYLLTGKSEYLATYMTSFPEIPRALIQLQKSVQMLPEHEAPMAELEDLMDKKLDELKLTVVLQQAEKEDDALALIQTDRGEALMNRIHAILDGLDRMARHEAMIHQTFVRRYASVLNLTIAAGTLMTLLLVAAFAFFTRNEIKRRTRSELELRTAQNAALVASKLKSQFLATVSHEIRTPLNGIIGMSDLLRVRVKDPENRRFVDIIHNSGHALLKIVNDILDFSKIEAGRIDFELSEFTLIDSVESTVDLFSAQAREKKLTLLSYLDPALPARLVGDASRVSQILRNLISNAIKFTNEGSVTVRAKMISRPGDKAIIRFEVTDTGRGIDPQNHRLLFQAFNQVTEPNAKREGTGLGLSICKDLTEAMGGQIGVESALKKGATFWVELPFQVKTESTVAEVSPVLLPPWSLFVVGGERNVVSVLQLYALEWGCGVVESADWDSQDTGALIAASVESFANSKEAKSKPVVFVSTEDELSAKLIEDLERLSVDKSVRLVLVGDAVDDLSPRVRALAKDAWLSEPFKREHLQSLINGNGPAASAPAAHIIPDASSALILLVEDNQTNQLLAEVLLQDLGHRVHTVANGREAVEALTRISYDVVLMDCQMPVMDGYEATRLIRERESTLSRHTPIIAMTANALESDRERCFAVGMDDFLAKPFQASDLSDKLRRWVKVETRGSVDWAVLHDLAAKTNASVVTRLIASFMKTLPNSLREMSTALGANDAQALRAWAHQLKSSSASLGALELHALCKRLESSVESGSSFAVVEAATRDLMKTGEIVLAEFKAQTKYV